MYLSREEDDFRCPVYDRSALLADDCIDGPAIAEQYDSTVYLPRGCRARVDGQGNLRIKVASRR